MPLLFIALRMPWYKPLRFLFTGFGVATLFFRWTPSSVPCDAPRVPPYVRILAAEIPRHLQA